MVLEKGNGNVVDRNWLSIVVALIASIVLIFLGKMGWLEPIQIGASYIFSPIYETSANWGASFQEFFSTIGSVSEFRGEYNEMKLEIARYELENLEYQLLQDENEDLRTQLNLINREYSYIKGDVLDHIESDYIIINVGIKDGIGKGDVVVLGKTLIGIIIDVGRYTSKVRLPISKSNFLESYIINSDSQKDQKILSRAVVSGSSEGIVIENIGMNSGVNNGDIVVVNDDKVGENLVLGTVVGLSEDPASTTRSGYVSPAVDYYDLTNVFVRVRNAH